MALRPYGKGDLDALYALDVACFAPRFRFTRNQLARLVAAKGAVVLLACSDPDAKPEQLLGFCLGSAQRQGGERVGYIATLDVAEQSRRQGVGAALLAATESELRRAGAGRVVLHVWVENRPAVRLYEAGGYVREEHLADFYGEGHHAWRFSKLLSPRAEAT